MSVYRSRWWETHAYTFATALACGQSVHHCEALRVKAIRYGATIGELMLVARHPARFIKQGFNGMDDSNRWDAA